MGWAEIENLKFLGAEVEGHAITKGSGRQPRPLLFGGRATAFHLVEKASTVVLVPDLEHVRIRHVSLAERIVEGRGNKVANGLFGGGGNRFPFRACDRFRI